MAQRKRSDATEVRELLLWARGERIVLGQVTIGACTVTVLDLGANRDVKPVKRDRERDFKLAFAGQLADQMVDAGVIDDDEPAVQ